jgi:hypothetical protein
MSPAYYPDFACEDQEASFCDSEQTNRPTTASERLESMTLGHNKRRSINLMLQGDIKDLGSRTEGT